MIIILLIPKASHEFSKDLARLFMLEKFDSASTSLYPLVIVFIKSIKLRLQIEDGVFLFFACGNGNLLEPDNQSDLNSDVVVVAGEWGLIVFSVLRIGGTQHREAAGKARTLRWQPKAVALILQLTESSNLHFSTFTCESEEKWCCSRTFCQNSPSTTVEMSSSGLPIPNIIPSDTITARESSKTVQCR
ncbi:hypothetical protein ACFX16_046736 [Malus domestica]